MKKAFIGAMMLVAALVVTSCGNQNQPKENTKEEVKEVVEEEWTVSP